MRRVRLSLAVAALAAFFVVAVTAGGADTFTVRLVSQTSSTITLGWDPQPGYGYLFSADGVLQSRTNDASRTTVKFSKSFSTYEVAVIAKGAFGTYPTAPPPPPPPPKAACEDGLDNDGDGKVDLADPGCSGLADTDETDPAPVPTGCDLNATTANFASQVTAATAGQTVCLASGNYGTFNGTNKTVTIRAATGAAPQMKISLGSGDTGFTLDGMTGMGGFIGGVSNVTIKNSVFTDTLDTGGVNTNVVLDGNTHNWNAVYSGGLNAKIYLDDDGNATLGSPSFTIKNSQIKNGDLDGIHIGDGSGYQIVNNTFDNLCDRGTNHTDNLQFDTTVITQTRIAGNYVHAIGTSCETQGITSYDHGTNGVIIENNVVDVPRPWGIELYADVNSIVRHNTLIFHPSSACFFNTTCGKINVTNKSGDPVSTGTQVYDNLAVADIGSCTGCSVHHNVSSQNAVYVGPQTFHDGFLLSPSSPVGIGAASDGTNDGVYATGG